MPKNKCCAIFIKNYAKCIKYWKRVCWIYLISHTSIKTQKFHQKSSHSHSWYIPWHQHINWFLIKSLFFFQIHKQSQKTELNKLRIFGIIILVVRSLVGDEMIARKQNILYFFLCCLDLTDLGRDIGDVSHFVSTFFEAILFHTMWCDKPTYPQEILN